MSTTTAEEILRLEALLTEAKRTLDLETIERLYADDLLLTGVLGEPTCSKGAIVDEITRGRADRDAGADRSDLFQKTITNEDVKIVTHGNTAVASYRFVVTATGPSVDVHRRFRTTNVWMKRNGSWQIVAAHTAFVIDPKQAAILSG